MKIQNNVQTIILTFLIMFQSSANGLCADIRTRSTLSVRLAKDDGVNSVLPVITQARIIAKALLRSEPVEESTVKTLFLTIAAEILSPEGLKVFNKDNEFYDELNSAIQAQSDLLHDSDMIATGYLQRVSFVRGILPAGQFYCDMYDPLNRRFLSLIDLADGSISEFDFLRRDLPDYDFLHIYDFSNDTPYTLVKNNDERLRKFFKKYATGTAEWKRIVEEELVRDYGDKKHPIASIKCTSAVAERKSLQKKMLKENSFALCFGNPIPRQLWNCLDIFIQKGDYSYLNCIRDFIIGLEDPLYLAPECEKEIIVNFRINYLLCLLEQEGSLRDDEVVSLGFREIAHTMPKRPRHDAATGLVKYSTQHWQKTLADAASMGLIVKRNDRYSITDNGRERLGGVLALRNKIIASGEISDGVEHSVRDELRDIYKKHGSQSIPQRVLASS